MKIKYKYHYFYKITNLINGHFYYGVHNTNNLEDGYMGSGNRLQYAYKKYGIENFNKEILKYFDTSKEAFEYEAEIVTEDLVKDNNCYNQKMGGDYNWKTTKNTVMVFDTDGNTFRVHKDDPKYLSGEFKGITSGFVTGEDQNGNRFFVSKNDIRFTTGELHHLGKGKANYKDKNGNLYYLPINDKRVLSGELFSLNIGQKRSEEVKQKIKNSLIGKDKTHKTCWVCNKYESIKINKSELNNYLNNGYQKGKTFKEIKNEKLHLLHQQNNYQLGEKNSQYGTCWIYNDKECIKIKKDQLEEYISKGWIKGRKMKF